MQAAGVSEPLAQPSLGLASEDGIVCRCERITLGQIVEYIKTHRIRDANQLKQLRVAKMDGMSDELEGDGLEGLFGGEGGPGGRQRRKPTGPTRAEMEARIAAKKKRRAASKKSKKQKVKSKRR